MKRNNKKIQPKSSLKLAFLFLGFVAIIIIISILWRFVNLVKTSRFDGTNQLIVQSKQNENTALFIVYNPVNQSIVTMRIKNVNNTSGSLSAIIGLPVDAYLPKADGLNFPTLSFSSLLLPKEKTELNFLDLIRIYIYNRSIPGENKKNIDISLSARSEEIDKKIASFFNDPEMQQENKTISIINASGEVGIGSRMERQLEHLGVNVISVISGRQLEKKSRIEFYKEKSYTSERLSRLFQIPTVISNNKALSDIIIVLGADKEGAF